MEYIDIQHCNVHQTTLEGVKSDWVVRKNITGEPLYSFPGHYDEQTIFLFLDFAKKFELIAFNAGINFQKRKQNLALKEDNRVLKLNLAGAIKRTEQLSNMVENFQHSGAIQK
ncbi:MAG: hypothetical protein DRI46_06805 [Chloroflexi bacterium]|nr:MAG: hypothetical protein DRI46_06805 [Chloroflexota bacterium]